MYVIQALLALEFTMSIYVLFLLDLGLSMTQVMILEMIFMFAIVLLEVPSGVFADLFGRKNSLLIAKICLSIGFLMVGLAEGFLLILLAQFVIAIAWSFSSGADEALVYDSLKTGKKEKDFKKILGRFNFVRQGTWTIVSILGGLLATYFAYRNLFYLTAGFFFIAFIFAFSLREPPKEKNIIEHHYLKHLKDAVRFSFTHVNVRFYILYFSMFGAVSHLTWFLIQPYYLNRGSSVFFIGIVMAVYFGTYAIGSLLTDKISKYFDERRLLFYLVGISALSFIALYFTSPVMGLVAIGIMSLLCGIREVLISDGINKVTDSHHRATVLSVKNLGKGGIYIIFAFIIGRATDVYSPAFAFLLMGIGLTLFTILLFSGRSQEHRKEKTTDK